MVVGDIVIQSLLVKSKFNYELWTPLEAVLHQKPVCTSTIWDATRAT